MATPQRVVVKFQTTDIHENVQENPNQSIPGLVLELDNDFILANFASELGPTPLDPIEPGAQSY